MGNNISKGSLIQEQSYLQQVATLVKAAQNKSNATSNEQKH